MRPNGGSAGSGVSERVEAFLRDLRDDAQCLRRPNQIIVRILRRRAKKNGLVRPRIFKKLKGLDLADVMAEHSLQCEGFNKLELQSSKQALKGRLEKELDSVVVRSSAGLKNSKPWRRGSAKHDMRMQEVRRRPKALGKPIQGERSASC
jgi:hypothetical protein